MQSHSLRQKRCAFRRTHPSGTPTYTWCVVVDAALYGRGYTGQHSSWYQAAVRRRAGRDQVADIRLNTIRDLQ